jgi:hypothetical protein
MWAHAEGITLCAERLSATERQDFGVRQKTRQSTQFTRNLVCQFTGRAQHQRLGLKQCDINMLQQPKTECSRFTTARFRLHAHITPSRMAGSAAA